ncbi:MAG: hypothetical protein VB093_20395 [Propionicimonas sp.]|nr:hypothetical protein [Propionicimonas sp.]MEA5116300.1 hypothetical protein [Propionicimonas sp.]
MVFATLLVEGWEIELDRGCGSMRLPRSPVERTRPSYSGGV